MLTLPQSKIQFLTLKLAIFFFKSETKKVNLNFS